jgi:hypothetical protein
MPRFCQRRNGRLVRESSECRPTQPTALSKRSLAISKDFKRIEHHLAGICNDFVEAGTRPV